MSGPIPGPVPGQQDPPFPTPGPRAWATQITPHPPALLALQPLAVGGDLHVQGQLDVHELLVLTQLLSHVLLGGSQSGFQLSHLGLSILDGQLAALLSILDGRLQGSPLAFEALDLSLDSADVPVTLRKLNGHPHASQPMPAALHT